MLKLRLSIATLVMALAVTGMNAQAKGGTVSGWTGSTAPASTPTSSSTGGSRSGTGSSGGVHGYSAMAGYNLANGSGSAASNGLQLNPNGTISHVGLMAGSMSSGAGSSLVGQSSVNTGLGIGNSQVGSRNQGLGNSQVNVWTMGIGNSEINLNAQLAAGSRISSQSGSSMMPSTASNIMGYLAAALGSITSPQTSGSKMGMPTNKACAGSSGGGEGCH